MKRAYFSFLLALSSTFFGLGLAIADEQGLTEVPSHFSDAAAPAAQTSRITLLATVNLSTLRDEADAAIADPVATISESRGGCYKAKIGPIPVSVGCDIWGSVTKRGPLSLSGEGASLFLSLPIHATVSAKTHRVAVQETAAADATVSAVAAPALGSDWRLSLNLQPDFRWDNPPTVCLFNVICLTIRSIVDPKVREQLGKVSASAEERVKGLKIREKAEKAWSRLQEPLRLSESPEVWLVAKPSSIGFSGIAVTGETLSASAQIEATLTSVVGKKPESAPAAPLPALGSVTSEAGRFSLVVPVLVDYTTIEREFSKAIGIGQASAPIGGQPALKVTPSGVEVYPSGDKIAVKVSGAVDTPLLDANVVFHLAAKPVIDNANRAIRFEDLTFARETDSLAAEVIGRLLDPWLKAKLAGSAAIPYGVEYDKLLARANAALNRDLSDGIVMEGKLGTAEVLGIAVQEKALRADLKAEGEVKLRFGM